VVVKVAPAPEPMNAAPATATSPRSPADLRHSRIPQLPSATLSELQPGAGYLVTVSAMYGDNLPSIISAPVNLQTLPKCADGSTPAVDGSCPQPPIQCSDGSTVPADQTCPPTVSMSRRADPKPGWDVPTDHHLLGRVDGRTRRDLPTGMPRRHHAGGRRHLYITTSTTAADLLGWKYTVAGRHLHLLSAATAFMPRWSNPSSGRFVRGTAQRYAATASGRPFRRNGTVAVLGGGRRACRASDELANRLRLSHDAVGR
jgi:hypothetical protein